ncbi:hypothetical protein UWK_03611 (plasmid) [Desulfocapsa sulfexigens DSM 10523]|uniref:DUF7673 domain-containing protein n=1 Tax=Desulfocapsa sulfexigens (strain DSM 10523 / SB164P1) TaxID=1167006 RepID=M1PKT7_DESSD|nr:hypothetical protein [Desulfocapsa sulfexigens]AGF80120.1 hypothetical protein UWK_03611 [Desulfocapsa sulfexigens DSM 10523]
MEQIPLDEYIAGVETLVPLAQGDTGGARVAAQVLLSAYNGEDYQLNIVDLGLLDEKHYQAALAVIRGRTELRAEPHTLIFDGDKIFKTLWQDWKGYHVQRRSQLYE